MYNSIYNITDLHEYESFLYWIANDNTCVFGHGDKGLYAGILTYALYKKGLINKASYNSRFKSIRNGNYAKDTIANRKSNMLERQGIYPWVNDATMMERLLEEVVKTNALHGFNVDMEVLVEVVMKLNLTLNKRQAKVEAENLQKSYVADKVLNTYYGGTSYETLKRKIEELNNLGYDVYMPSEDRFSSGYCCSDCDGDFNQYVCHRIDFFIHNLKYEILNK